MRTGLGGRHGDAMGIREGMGGGVAVEGEENGVCHHAWHVQAEKPVLGVLITGAALHLNVK